MEFDKNRFYVAKRDVEIAVGTSSYEPQVLKKGSIIKIMHAPGYTLVYVETINTPSGLTNQEFGILWCDEDFELIKSELPKILYK